MTDNNGNLKKQEVYIPNDDQISGYDNYAQFYEYDSLNRLQAARENKFGGAVNWQQAYIYDRWGNRTIDQTNTWGSGIPNPNFGVDTSTNRLTAPGGYTMSYDSAGNLTFDSSDGIGGTRTYDAENHMTQAWANNQWQTYTYDGDGHRVKRNVNGTETWQVYGIGGELIAEYATNASPSSPQKEYGYRNGQLLVTAEPSAQIHWLVTDQLGTPRMILDLSGNLNAVSRHDYLPFGEELCAGVDGRLATQGYVGDSTRQKFTQKERDNETALDWFDARYYSSGQGRFTSPDSLGGRLVNPQTLNLYSYVRNNPLKYSDPTGHFAQDPNRPHPNKPCSEQSPCEPDDNSVLVTNTDQKKNTPVKEPSNWDSFNRTMWSIDFAIPRYIFKFEKFSFSPISSSVRAIGGEQAHRNYVDATMALLPLGLEAQAEVEAERAEAALEGEMDELLEVTIDSAKHPEAAEHILDAQGAGYPRILTLDREGAAERRAESLQGIPKIPGKQLDEYPPAIFKENGGQAAVRPISPAQNMGAGARIGNGVRGVPNGRKVRIKVN